MKIHEFQGKQLLKKYQIPIQDGLIVEDIDNIDSIISEVQKKFNTEAVIVKAQIHAGGRGKGGGVKFCPTKEDALLTSRKLFGSQLITHQTSEQGQKVRKLYITEALDISKEFYVAITLDRNKGKNVIMVSTEGGVDIEKVAEENPEKIHKVWTDPNGKLNDADADKLALSLEVDSSATNQASSILKKMYECYIKTDATIVEINPLILSESNNIIALDAKFNFDSNALFKHPDILDMRDPYEEDEAELEASKYNLNYIKLDGNVGCMVNGAGLAMATMDIIKLAGGEPANFLDVGGAANIETIKNGFKIILQDENVKVIIINIFGGIVRCDRVANGVVEAIKELDLKVPVVVRLEGTNADIAKQILINSNVDVISANGMKDAANKAVSILNK